MVSAAALNGSESGVRTTLTRIEKIVQFQLLVFQEQISPLIWRLDSQVTFDRMGSAIVKRE